MCVVIEQHKIPQWTQLSLQHRTVPKASLTLFGLPLSDLAPACSIHVSSHLFTPDVYAGPVRHCSAREAACKMTAYERMHLLQEDNATLVRFNPTCVPENAPARPRKVDRRGSFGDV